MSASRLWWTPERCAKAIAILRVHRTVESACAAMSAAFDSVVTPSGLASGLCRYAGTSVAANLGIDLAAEALAAGVPRVDCRETVPSMRSADPVELPDDSGTTVEAKKEASRGWAPDHDWTHPVPDGHRVKGNSTLYDADGELAKQWVKSERDSDDPTAFEPVPEGHLIKKVSTLLDGQGKVRARRPLRCAVADPRTPGGRRALRGFQDGGGQRAQPSPSRAQRGACAPPDNLHHGRME